MKQRNFFKGFVGVSVVDSVGWMVWSYYASWCGALSGFPFLASYLCLAVGTLAGTMWAFHRLFDEGWHLACAVEPHPLPKPLRAACN